MTAQESGEMERSAAMQRQTGRRVVVVHEANPHAFAFRPQLDRLLGGRYFRREAGNGHRPEAGALLASAIAQDPDDHCVAWVRHSIPPALVMDETSLRSLFPVAHPVVRYLNRLADSVRADLEKAGTALSFENVSQQVAKLLAEQIRPYPLANFHAGFLLGGAPVVSLDAVTELAERVLERCVVGLADFPSAIAAQLAAELVAAGAPLEAPINLAPDGSTKALERLQAWQRALPVNLFRLVCSHNRADLAFYDLITAGMRDRLPVSGTERQRIAATIDAMAAITGHRDEIARNTATKVNPAFPKLLEPDPVLGWRLVPGTSSEKLVSGEQIVNEVDANGCRPVPGQPNVGEKTLAVFGCSFVYGMAVAAEHTMCAKLQEMLPSWRIENHGVHGYSQIHNFIQLSRQLKWEPPDYVTFTWVPEHLRRNVADVLWVQAQRHQVIVGRNQPHRITPRAFLDKDGNLQYRDCRFPRAELNGLDMADFTHSDHYMDQVCFVILQQAATRVRQNNGHFFVTVLHERPSDRLCGLLADAGIPLIQASISGPEHLAADGLHPAPSAHLHFAKQIHQHLTDQMRVSTT